MSEFWDIGKHLQLPLFIYLFFVVETGFHNHVIVFKTYFVVMFTYSVAYY